MGAQASYEGRGSATGLVSPFIRHKSSLASPHVLVAKIRTTPLRNALQVPHPRLERTTRRPATLPALVPDKRQRKGLPQDRKLLAPRR